MARSEWQSRWLTLVEFSRVGIAGNASRRRSIRVPRCEPVTLENVPSYRTRADVRIEVPGIGPLTAILPGAGTGFFLVKDYAEPIEVARVERLLEVPPSRSSHAGGPREYRWKTAVRSTISSCSEPQATQPITAAISSCARAVPMTGLRAEPERVPSSHAWLRTRSWLPERPGAAGERDRQRLRRLLTAARGIRSSPHHRNAPL